MNNFSVLPFYGSIKSQYHRLPYSYGNLYKLYVSDYNFIPFQIPCPKPTSSSGYYEITKVELYDLNDKLIKDCTDIFISAGLYIYKSEFMSCWVIVFPGTSQLSLGVPHGQYYLYIGTGSGGSFYSDVFTLADISDCVVVEWYDNEDLIIGNKGIAYDGNFRNVLYLDTNIGRPDYEYEEEGETRDYRFFAEKQLSEKIYKFSFVAPEYLCDAIRLIRMSDNVTIRQGYDSPDLFECDSFTAEVEWLDQGDLASVNVEFKAGTIIKKIAPGFDDYNGDYNVAYTNE